VRLDSSVKIGRRNRSERCLGKYEPATSLGRGELLKGRWKVKVGGELEGRRRDLSSIAGD